MLCLGACVPDDQMYSQVDMVMMKTKKNKLAKTTSSAAYQSPDSEVETPVDQLYARVDKKKKEKGEGSGSSETAVDQLYAQVDKKKKGKKKAKEDEEPTSSPETAVDQLYAQVDKKKKGKKKAKEDEAPTSSLQTPDAQVDELTSSPETAVDQLYAQVDKKKKKKSKEKEVCPEELGAVYSVVNKPSPPQVPTKSQELLDEL